MKMEDVYTILKQFPEDYTEFNVDYSEGHLTVEHKGLDSDKGNRGGDLSSLSLLFVDESIIELKLIMVTEGMKRKGYGTKIMNQIILYCMREKLDLVIDLCYSPIYKIVRNLCDIHKIKNHFYANEEEEGLYNIYLLLSNYASPLEDIFYLEEEEVIEEGEDEDYEDYNSHLDIL